MTLDDFHDLLDRCGADQAHWPAGAPAAAARLLETSHEARRALEALAAAEAALVMTRDGGGAADYAAVAVRSRQRPGDGADVVRRRVALALAASLIVSLGLAAGSVQRSSEDPASVLTAALGGGGESADAE